MLQFQSRQGRLLGPYYCYGTCLVSPGPQQAHGVYHKCCVNSEKAEKEEVNF